MSSLTGTGTLLRLAARRDRVLIPSIVTGLAVLTVASAQATIALYDDPARLLKDVGGMASNPAFLAMYGPLVSPPSVDSFAVFKTLMMGAVFLGIGAYAVLRRHTRTEEEEGRLELVGAGAVGRRAPLAAAVLLALGMVVLTCLANVSGMLALGMDATGTLAFAVSWLCFGAVMTAVTAVAAQVTTTARGCGAIALGFLALSFLLRAVGDAVDGAGAVAWISPLGWMQKVEPYGGNRFWIGLLSLATFVALIGLAFALLERRDLGAGLVAARPGPGRAGRWLGSPLGLAWRLQRWSLLGWSAGMVLVGALIGSLAKQVTTMLEDPATQDLLRQLGGNTSADLTDLFLSAEFAFSGLAIAGYGISSTLRLRGEEREVHAEQVLATSTNRWTWLGSHLVIALLGTAWLQLVLGATAGLLHGLALGDVPGTVVRLMGAALAPLPAVWVCVGLTVLVFGLVPRWTSGAWILLILFLVVGEFGSVLGLPSWVSELSPFAHLPSLPGGAVSLAPLIAVVAVAVALVASGSVSFRRRDVG